MRKLFLIISLILLLGSGPVYADLIGSPISGTCSGGMPTGCDDGEMPVWVAATSTWGCSTGSGTGDVTGVGDCADGACYDGSSDGGTYVRLYDGTSAYTSITAGVRTLTLLPSNANAESLVLTFGDNDNIITLSSGTAAASLNLNAFAVSANGFLPDAADGAALGSATAEFSDLYLADGGVIYFQNDQSVYLTPSAGTLTLTGALAGTSSLTLGVNTTTTGSLKMFGGTSGDVTLTPAAAAGTATAITVPATSGTMAVLASGACAAAGCQGWDGTDKYTFFGNNSEDFYIRVGSAANVNNIGSTTSALITFDNAVNMAALLGADATAGVRIGTTGVLITSDNDGAITFLGASGGYDEDLTINLDDTENTAVVSSSTGVTKIDFSALNLTTTGIITGAVNTNTDTNGMSSAEMTAAGLYGTMFWATGAGTWALPTAAAGMSFCIYSTTAAAVVINPDDGDTIVLNGTALSAGDSITSASGAGDFICLLAKDADTWYTLGRSGTWTDTN